MLLTLALSLALRSASFEPSFTQAPAIPPQDSSITAKREADVCNYVTTRLRLLKRGTAVDALKDEIVNQIDFGTIPPRSVDVLRRMMTLCDKALESQIKIKQQLSALDAQESKADSEALLALGGAIMAPALPTIAAALSQITTTSGTTSKKETLLAQSTADLGGEISAMEFDVAILRSQVETEGHLPSTEFIGPGDYDQFLAATASTVESERIAGVCAALARSPRMQPAALHLAMHFLRTGDRAKCVQHADEVIEGAPRILRRDALRAQAYFFKACAAVSERNYKAAVEMTELGLKDDPANTGLLLTNAMAIVEGGDHATGLPLFEKLALLLPKNPTVFYDLACCYAVVRKDPDLTLSNFKLALDGGFTRIDHARKDPDLALLRDKRRADFEALTTLALRVEMEWNLLNSDGVIITNESPFTLENIKLALTFTGRIGRDASRGSWSTDRTLEISRLAPGKQQRFASVINTTRDELGALHLVADGPQGRFEATYQVKDLERRPAQAPRSP